MKTIAIFGGSGGLGGQLAHELHWQKVHWYPAFPNDEWVPDLKYSVRAISSKDVDIRYLSKCKEFFENESIDIVINLAGINFNKMIHKFDEEDGGELFKMLDVNLTGAVNIAAAALPGMRERGYGRFIYASSVLAQHQVLGTGIYSSCKAFIDRLVKSISAENISKGITANSLQLGYFDGGLTYRLPDPESFKEKIPLKRWGTIKELVNTVNYLVETEYITGQNIQISGGL